MDKDDRAFALEMAQSAKAEYEKQKKKKETAKKKKDLLKALDA